MATLYWNNQGAVNCPTHAPYRGSDTWCNEQWQAVPPELLNQVRCEICVRREQAKTRTEIIAAARERGFKTVLTSAGPVPLDDWKPYGDRPWKGEWTDEATVTDVAPTDVAPFGGVPLGVWRFA